MVEFRRTHHCGQLRKENIGEQVRLSGWVHRYRDHGGLIFIDLRDRFGLTQLVFDPDKAPDAHVLAETLRSEWVVTAVGEVISRAEGMANPNLDTGDIEVSISSLDVLSKAKTPPFSVCDELLDVKEDLRLKYRYLDMRRGRIAQNLLTRHQAMIALRNYLDQHGFIEVMTPILGKSTPEGARDYLVPSRVYPGSFYALPQSPQIFKQLLMVGGMDRYFQVAPCFRDEDLRSERQPEFHQVDLEMSFVTQEEVFAIAEGIVQAIFKQTLGEDVAVPFQRMPYTECVDRYGTDKPDLRFGMELINLNQVAEQSSFGVFQEQLKTGGIVKGLCVKGGSDISRKGIDEYTKFVGQLGIKGLAWMKYGEEGLASNIVKFFPEEAQKLLIELSDAEPGDLLFMIADEKDRTHQALDHLRRKLARDRNLIRPGHFEGLWVTDFPLFTWDLEDQRIASEHHPFTSPNFEDMDLLDTEPLKMRSLSYDLVLNGYELGSGSQRVHDPELQRKIFEVLKLSEEEIQEKFGFFVNALQYGTPPHIGIALGLDRLIMILAGTDHIRDVIAFPKTQRAGDLMMECPSPVGDQQLNDLCIGVHKEKTFL